MTTKIVKCMCKHDAQDSMYGVGNRVANEMRTGQFKCTVCGVVHGGVFDIRSVKAAAEEPANQQKSSSKVEKGKSSKDKKPKARRGLKWGKK